jgi:cytochrome b pre-mRNA-processing protein 3
VIALSFLERIFGGRSDRERMLPAYERIVAAGRDPAWYRQGQVPDTIDGRFDIIAAVMALVLIRLEREQDRRTQLSSTLLTELFIDDMDGSLRQLGVGDLVVGKHMGRMMGALGGRLGAFREAVKDEHEMRAAVRRNVFHEAPPSDEALAFVAERLLRFHAALDASAAPSLLQGEIPRL